MLRETEAAQQIEELLRAQEICRNVAALHRTAHYQAGTVDSGTTAQLRANRQLAHPLGREVYDQPEDLQVDRASASLSDVASRTVVRASIVTDAMWGEVVERKLLGSFRGGSAIPKRDQTP